MATKKKAAKKVAPKKPVKKGAPKKSAGQKSPKKEPIRIVIELIVKNETPPILLSDKNKISPLGGEEKDPNFQFKFTVPQGVYLTKIDIDGYEFSREKLERASKVDADGKLVVEVYVPPYTTPLPMTIEAVGEPNRVMSFTLKFDSKDVYKDDNAQKITIGDSRRGRLDIAEVNLP